MKITKGQIIFIGNVLFRISMGMETSQSYYNNLCVEKQELTGFCLSWQLSSYHSGR